MRKPEDAARARDGRTRRHSWAPTESSAVLHEELHSFKLIGYGRRHERRVPVLQARARQRAASYGEATLGARLGAAILG